MRGRRLALCGMVTVVLVGLAACGGDEDAKVSGTVATTSPTGTTGAPATSVTPTTGAAPATSRPATTTAGNTAEGAVVTALPAADLTLLDPGAEPRQALRLALTAGTTQRQILTVGLGPGGSAPSTGLAPTDPVTADLQVVTTVEAVGADGVARVEQRTVAIPSGVPGAGGSPGRGFVMLLTAEVDPRGNVLALARRTVVAGVEALEPDEEVVVRGTSFADTGTFLGIAFPEAPVGVGARWRLVASEPGLPTSSREVSLLGVDADRVRLHVDDEDGRAEVGLVTTSTADVVVDLGAAMPWAADVTITTTVSNGVGGEPIRRTGTQRLVTPP